MLERKNIRNYFEEAQPVQQTALDFAVVTRVQAMGHETEQCVEIAQAVTTSLAHTQRQHTPFNASSLFEKLGLMTPFTLYP
jgi:acetylornithine/succinyldiaminopimelate/putrescine aminotransferase